jgi:hypothetical protein
MGIRPGRIQSHAVKLNGILRIEAPIFLTPHDDGLLLSIHKELQPAGVHRRIESRKDEVGLGDPIDTRLANEELQRRGGGQVVLHVVGWQVRGFPRL